MANNNETFAVPNAGIFFSNTKGAVELRRTDKGGYSQSEEDGDLLVFDLIASGQPVSQHAVWDNRAKAPAKRMDKPYTAAQFKALVASDEYALIWVRRSFGKVPVLKVGNLTTRPQTGKRPAAQRFGK